MANPHYATFFTSKNYVAMLRRRKRENSRENEENSVKTDELVQIEIFPNPENFPVFAVLIYPPGIFIRK